jgi:hypothetical protein
MLVQARQSLGARLGPAGLGEQTIELALVAIGSIGFHASLFD